MKSLRKGKMLRQIKADNRVEQYSLLLNIFQDGVLAMKRENPRVLSASTLIGDKVRNRQGEDIGKIEEFMIDLQNGCISYAVLSFGGIMGIGDKLFAIPWKSLTVDTKAHEIVLDIAKERLEKAPGFNKDDWPDFADQTWGTEVHKFYNAEPYWKAR